MIGQTHALMFNLIEEKIMALKPRPKGIDVRRTHKLNTKTGILEPIDKTPPHVKQARRYKRNKVTGVKAAK